MASVDPASHEQWSVIVTMSEVMLHHAETGEWLELAGLESQRRALIARDMRPPQDGTDTDSYANILQRILALDSRIMALAQSGHATLAKQLHTIGLGRCAVQAYARQHR